MKKKPTKKPTLVDGFPMELFLVEAEKEVSPPGSPWFEGHPNVSELIANASGVSATTVGVYKLIAVETYRPAMTVKREWRKKVGKP